MSKYFSIGQASKILGVAPSTLRRWEREERLIPDMRTHGGQRRYKLTTLEPFRKHGIDNKELETLAYARVSSADQKEDLKRQQKLLEVYCASNGWKYGLISDLGSGMNYHKKGLRKLLTKILEGEIGRLVITHKDRLLRFGAELVFSLCEAKEVEVVIINKGEELTFEEELAKDVLEIITVFSARLYGARSHKNRKLLKGMQKAVEDAKKP